VPNIISLPLWICQISQAKNDLPKQPQTANHQADKSRVMLAIQCVALDPRSEH